MTQINGIDKKQYYKNYYKQYKSKYKNKKLMDELDKSYPNRIEKRKQYWYKYQRTNYVVPYKQINIVYSSSENPCILSFD